MSIREEQCNKVCRILDDVLANRPTERDSLIVATRNAFSALSEPHWIQCSETVDIPDHEILACDKYGEEMFGYLAYEDDQWLCVSNDCMMYDPIAWREKPEQYREEGD